MRAAARHFVCVHGHFYQPPRENPWSERVELEPSATPDHDWNVRIWRECYRANAAARQLGADGLIRRISSNYERMSFDVGPTLLDWLLARRRPTYERIVRADRASVARFSGHGSAIAHPYYHAILPLLEPRARRRLVRWGIAAFRTRFGREPEGMWLPECGVDRATLDDLAAEGIRFTVLAPSQAAVPVDTRRPYRVRTSPERSIAVFFYDGALSHAVAFDRLLSDGRAFADRLVAVARHASTHATLAHIATDGETFGHHHAFGDMALAEALERIELSPDVTLTNYGEFLERFPPRVEVEVAEGTAWSCAHGLERWRSGCPCGESRPGGTAWRAPLFEAMRWLTGEVTERAEAMLGRVASDPEAAIDRHVAHLTSWPARDSPGAAAAPPARLDQAPDAAPERADHAIALQALEALRHMLAAWTSCGWFFDDPSRPETALVLRQAARAIELVDPLAPGQLEHGFRSRLAGLKSSDPAVSGIDSLWAARVDRARSRGAARQPAVAHILERLEQRDAEGDLFDLVTRCYEALEAAPEGPERHELAALARHLGIGA